MKFKIWWKEYLKYYVQPVSKITTFSKYREIGGKHLVPELGEYDLDSIKTQKLRRLAKHLVEKKLANSTINCIISILKASLKQAVKVGITKKEYTACIIRLKEKEKKAVCFTVEEQKKIEGFALRELKHKPFGIIVCLYMGIRIGELLALQWDDVDLKRGLLTVNKTAHDVWADGKYKKVCDAPKTSTSDRVIPIPSRLLKMFELLKEKSIKYSKYVISDNKKDGVGSRTFQKYFDKVLERLNIPRRTVHALRHTFATRALECAMDVKTLSEILGHANATITLNRYAHSLINHKVDMMNKVGHLLF